MVKILLSFLVSLSSDALNMFRRLWKYALAVLGGGVYQAVWVTLKTAGVIHQVKF